MRVYYNEHDPYLAQWLCNLMLVGELPFGDIDTRPIEQVTALDVSGYDQCHFFAGIGGWALAARLAGWPDNLPLWTGSCPCQPYSGAGKRLADDDPRNLWPEFHRLIAKCSPSITVGEQVASKAGRVWLARVREDLEALGYGVGGADLCAAGVSAPHARQRLWWVADTDGGTGAECDEQPTAGVETPWRRNPDGCGTVRSGCGQPGRGGHEDAGRRMGDADRTRPQRRPVHTERADQCAVGAAGLDRGVPVADGRDGQQECTHAGRCGERSEAQGLVERPGRDGPWDDAEWIECADGKYRRLESGIAPLVDGLPADMGMVCAGEAAPIRVRGTGEAPWRKGMIQGYGNAIVPQEAAEFLMAYMDIAI